MGNKNQHRQQFVLGSSYVLLLLLNVALSTISLPQPPNVVGFDVSENAAEQSPLTKASVAKQSSPTMSIWQFVGKIVRILAPNDQLDDLDQLETTVRTIVIELDKQQNFYGNDTVVLTTTGQRLQLDVDGQQYFRPTDMRETGEIFQHWLEKNFNVAYAWAKNSANEEYRQSAGDFKAARDWIRGLSSFHHFTDTHVKIVANFFQNILPAQQPQWQAMKTAGVVAAFKQHLRDEAAAWKLNRVRREASTVDDDSFDLMEIDEEFRSVFMKHRNLTTWWDYIMTVIDYVEDAVVTYNRMQTLLWAPKMAVSFAWPPLKFIWTGVDVGACLFEELYELILALETEERWWDIFLCSFELLGIIPGGGAVKFGLRIAIRVSKFILGIHTVPWYITMPWGWFSNWWWPDNSTTTLGTTTIAAITMTTMRTTARTTTTTTSKPKGDPYNWNKSTAKPTTPDTEEIHWGGAVLPATPKPGSIIGSISVKQ